VPKPDEGSGGTRPAAGNYLSINVFSAHILRRVQTMMIEESDHPGPAARHDRYLTREAAALRLGIDLPTMVGWNMAVMIRHGSRVRVPEWCVDPRVARAIPLLSEHFRGEALEMCLLSMRPFGDDRNGVDALREGAWREVLALLAGQRRRFDQILSRADTTGWIARYCA
jgi:hypothetical protein